MQPPLGNRMPTRRGGLASQGGLVAAREHTEGSAICHGDPAHCSYERGFTRRARQWQHMRVRACVRTVRMMSVCLCAADGWLRRAQQHGVAAGEPPRVPAADARVADQKRGKTLAGPGRALAAGAAGSAPWCVKLRCHRTRTHARARTHACASRPCWDLHAKLCVAASAPRAVANPGAHSVAWLPAREIARVACTAPPASQQLVRTWCIFAPANESKGRQDTELHGRDGDASARGSRAGPPLRRRGVAGVHVHASTRMHAQDGRSAFWPRRCSRAARPPRRRRRGPWPQ